MTREEALERISRPELDERTLQNEFEYVCHKLDFPVEELTALFNLPKGLTKILKTKDILFQLEPIYNVYSVWSVA